MSVLIAAAGSVLGYIGALALIAWAEHCQPNAPACTLGGTAGMVTAFVAALVVGLALGGFTWRRLARWSAR